MRRNQFPRDSAPSSLEASQLCCESRANSLEVAMGFQQQTSTLNRAVLAVVARFRRATLRVCTTLRDPWLRILVALALVGFSACDDGAGTASQNDSAALDVPADAALDAEVAEELLEDGAADAPLEVADLTDAAQDLLDIVEDSSNEVADELDDVTQELPDDVALVCAEFEKRCSTTGNVETCNSNVFVETEDCAGFGCTNGVCEPSPTDACSAQTSLVAAGSANGSTDTLSDTHQWSNVCTLDYYGFTPTGPESVYALTIPTLGFYDIDLTSIDATYFGVYLRSACDDPTSELIEVCNGNDLAGGPIHLEGLFAKGSYSLFVDDFAENGNGPGAFSLSVQPKLTPGCYGQVPQVIDVSTGSVTLQGDTSTASNGTWAVESQCPQTAFMTTGAERSYAFALAQRKTVRITATPLTPADSELEIYLRSNCQDRYSQLACAYSPAGGITSTIQQELPAGGYTLFVDDFASVRDEAQTFTLTVEVL